MQLSTSSKFSKLRIPTVLFTLLLTLGAVTFAAPAPVGAASKAELESAREAAEQARAERQNAERKAGKVDSSLKEASAAKKAAAKADEQAKSELNQAQRRLEVSRARSKDVVERLSVATERRASREERDPLLVLAGRATDVASGEDDHPLLAAAGSLVVAGLTGLVGPAMGVVEPIDAVVDEKLQAAERAEVRTRARAVRLKAIESDATRTYEAVRRGLRESREGVSQARDALSAASDKVTKASEAREQAFTRVRAARSAERKAVAAREKAAEAYRRERAAERRAEERERAADRERAAERERAANRASRDTSSSRFRSPGTGHVTSSYGMRTHPLTGVYKLHSGLDLSAGDGRAYAASSGTVVSAGYEGAYGNMVTIEHGDGLRTRYAHLAYASVSPGERVAAGDVVGRIGSTGSSTGAHLHFEVQVNGEFRNPSSYLD